MGFEPTTFCMASRRSSQLSYSRPECVEYSFGFVAPRTISGAWNRQIGAESGVIWYSLKLGIGKIASQGGSPTQSATDGGSSNMHRKHLLSLLVALALSALAIAPAAASAWAPASSATIHPGVQVFTAGAQCTSNFVYQDGSNVYLGQAAHCSGTGSATDTNGCTSASLPIGTPVDVTGASKPGTLVYNSWLTMQSKGEADADTCAYNDLALIKIDPADVGSVNPSVPGFGGPTGVGSWGGTGSTVYTYGNSSLRGGVTTLSPKQGTVLQSTDSGWSHDVYTATPGIPGDSGSGFLNASGQAIGVLSTVQLAPVAGSNGVGDLGRCSPVKGHSRRRVWCREPSPSAPMQLALSSRASAPKLGDSADYLQRRRSAPPFARNATAAMPPPPRGRPSPPRCVRTPPAARAAPSASS